MFFTGFGISAVMGVVFNNTVVPRLGWDAMFIILGCFSVVSFLMLLFEICFEVFLPKMFSPCYACICKNAPDVVEYLQDED